MAVVSATSAAGLLAQLDETDDFLQLRALESLNALVHEFWFQIATSIASVEAFYEDESFSHRKLAALLASKVFYYLGELDDALTYALGAGELFDINEQSDYVNTLVSRCVDKFIELRADSSSGEQPIDSRLEDIIQRKFEQCYRDGAFDQAIGIALDARRLDKIEEIIEKSNRSKAVIDFAINVTQKLIAHRGFRESVLELLVKKAEALPEKDWVNIAQCFGFLDDAPRVAHILASLLSGSPDDCLLANQICYDLFENEMQAFLLKVEAELNTIMKIPSEPAQQSNQGEAANAQPAAANPPAEGDNPMTGDRDPAAQGSEPAGPSQASGAEQANGASEAKVEESVEVQRARKAHTIMRGNSSIQLYLEFLHRFNHADLQILKDLKARIESRNSVCHGAIVFANAVMHSGTTSDSFLRDNLEWLSRATNWAKFNATAGLGVIHRGHLSQGKTLMAPYLPSEGRQKSPYSEGGALFALGLIHANHGHDIRQFLNDSLIAAQSEVTQHGACLGLGLAALGTHDEALMETIKIQYVFNDNAVAGEAAGLAVGLIGAGSATEMTAELLMYARETQHEKITRGISLGLALIVYGREEGADTLIEQMTRDQDPIIRYGGMQAIGMAYRGTANNAAIQKLLHHAVSDVSDDVRRAAVMNLGFVLIGKPEQCPKIVALLSESYNPHVRYGSAMAIGIACSSTGSHSTDALNILRPLCRDTVDFVRQGGLIATALVLMQRTGSEVKKFRKDLQTIAGDKHEEVMSRLGAIMATGILDAGGRNAVVSLRSQSGFYKQTSCIGLMIFTQYWFWYPFSYFFSLALHPSAVIGLNADLQVPSMEFVAYGKPSEWTYPAPVKQDDSNKAAKVPQAVLSTTRRVGAEREKRVAKAAKKVAEMLVSNSEDAADMMEVSEKEGEKSEKPSAEAAEKKLESPNIGTTAEADVHVPAQSTSQAKGKGSANGEKLVSDSPSKPSKKDGDAKSESAQKSDEKPDETEKENEAKELIPLQNPTRVLPDQVPAVHFKKQSRYRPVDRNHAISGIILLRDSKPGEKVVLSGQEEQETTPEIKTEEKPDTEMKEGDDDEEDLPPPQPFRVPPGI